MNTSAYYRPLHEGEKIQVAFLFQAATVWPALESVYKACLEDDRIETRLVYDSRTTVETAHSLGARQFLDEAGYKYVSISDVDFTQYIPHVIFVQFPYDAAFHTPDMLSLNLAKRGSRIVYVPYGIEIADTPMARKDHFNSRVVENAWRIYTSCDGILAEYRKYCRNRRAVRALGAPRFDSIKNADKFPLSPEYAKTADGKKIIVWKLHFPKKNIVDGKPQMITPNLEEYLKFADTLDRYTDLFFIVLPHPKMMKGMVESDFHGDNDLTVFGEKLRRVLESKTNAAIDTSVDYRYSLYNADAMIIDRSAVMVEAGMLGKPVLYMSNPEYKEPMTVPVQMLVDTYEQGQQSEDMDAFVKRISEGKSFDLSSREKVLREVFSLNDGKSGFRIKEDIVASIMNEAKELSKPKVVLYGTGEVANYYMNDQGWEKPGDFEILAVADSNPGKQGRDFYGYPVIKPEEIIGTDYDYVVIMTEPHYYEIAGLLINDLYISDTEVIRLDEFVVNILPEVRDDHN